MRSPTLVRAFLLNEMTDIAPSLWSELNIFEQYSAAAYCKSNTESGNVTSQKVTCTDAGANNCPLVQNASTSIIAEFAKPVTLFWMCVSIN